MHRLYKVFFALTLFLFSAGTAAAQTDTLLYKKNLHYDHQIEFYKIYETEQADIVMLGNSITHGVKWNELLGRNDVVGRGIPSDILEGFVARLYYVTKLKPKIVFIMGGINDIYNWTSVSKIFETYKQVINRLQSLGIRPVIQSTLYVAESYPSSADRNTQVTLLNGMLKQYAEENDIAFINLNLRMSVGEKLKDYLTYDGVHLNAKGYSLWGRELQKFLSREGF